MRFTREHDWLEITAAPAPEGFRGSLVLPDVVLTVAVQAGKFCGRGCYLVERVGWDAFLQEFAELERLRRGGAAVEDDSAMLRLAFRIVDRAGHTEVEGSCRDGLGSALTFRLGFEPTQLEAALAEFREYGRKG